ncbi:hypothetical protein QQG55_37635 [Brugia pahangi]|uniref:Uncharacterized protein n=1 Tax=Brugia pahangi TaxID=6280 RepID=A0A0N4TT77_BRUPA|nr:unnamed protein product [Brugia pahangi]
MHEGGRIKGREGRCRLLGERWEEGGKAVHHLAECIPWHNYAFVNGFPDDIFRSGKFLSTDSTSMSTRCHHFYESVDPILHTNFIILLRIFRYPYCCFTELHSYSIKGRVTTNK